MVKCGVTENKYYCNTKEKKIFCNKLNISILKKNRTQAWCFMVPI